MKVTVSVVDREIVVRLDSDNDLDRYAVEGITVTTAAGPILRVPVSPEGALPDVDRDVLDRS